MKRVDPAKPKLEEHEKRHCGLEVKKDQKRARRVKGGGLVVGQHGHSRQLAGIPQRPHAAPQVRRHIVVGLREERIDVEHQVVWIALPIGRLVLVPRRDVVENIGGTDNVPPQKGAGKHRGQGNDKQQAHQRHVAQPVPVRRFDTPAAVLLESLHVRGHLPHPPSPAHHPAAGGTCTA